MFQSAVMMFGREALSVGDTSLINKLIRRCLIKEQVKAASCRYSMKRAPTDGRRSRRSRKSAHCLTHSTGIYDAHRSPTVASSPLIAHLVGSWWRHVCISKISRIVLPFTKQTIYKKRFGADLLLSLDVCTLLIGAPKWDHCYPRLFDLSAT